MLMLQARSPRRCDSLVLSQGLTPSYILCFPLYVSWCHIKCFLCCYLNFGLLDFWTVICFLESWVFHHFVFCGYPQFSIRWRYFLFSCYICDDIHLGAAFCSLIGPYLCFYEILLAAAFPDICAGHVRCPSHSRCLFING
jgi:hypothetical protein